MTDSATDTPPLLKDVVRIWRANHCLQAGSIRNYRHWVGCFRAYCRSQGLEERSQLTLDEVRAFANWYAQRRGIQGVPAYDGARWALRAWALALEALGYATPRWEAPSDPKPPSSPLLQAFADHLTRHRGSSAATLKNTNNHATAFLSFLRDRQHSIQNLEVGDIDAFVIDCRKRYARTTVAAICSSLRSFLRFLHATGRLAANLAPAVMAPMVRRGERPRRTLPWKDVRRILRAVDRSVPGGQRDYMLLLLMSVYGLGAGEVIRLRLDDIDWHAATLRITRPKTGVEFWLPLLPAVAEALVEYLRHGRPMHVATRYLFLTLKAPHRRLGESSAVRQILVKHAQAAGVSAPYLGSHVLRHTHACRELEQGVPPKIIGDILGHRRPESTSAYLRVATERLREMALPVPK